MKKTSKITQGATLMLSEPLLIAIAQEVLGFALESTGVSDEIRGFIEGKKREKAYAEALGQAHARFSEQYPDEANSLFDEQFLKGCAKPILADALLRRPSLKPEDLAGAWAEQLGGDIGRKAHNAERMTPAAKEFLRLLDDELSKQDRFMDLYDSKAFESIAASSKRTATATERTADASERAATALEAIQRGEGGQRIPDGGDRIARVTFVLDLDTLDNNRFIALVAQLTRLGVKEILVISRQIGSIKLVLQMPEDAAIRLVELAEKKPELFAEFKLHSRPLLERVGRRLTVQTPDMARTFIGRKKDLRAVGKLLDGKKAVGIVAIHGTGGIGKTMLAEELARRLGSRYPGGVIYEKRGEAPRDAQETLRAWAGLALGQEVQKEVTPAEVRGALARFGKLLAVIDDVWPPDAQAVKLLLDALPEGTDRLLTSRNADLVRTLGAQVYELDKLNEADGLALLRDRLKDMKPKPEKALLLRLYRAFDGHALALELAAGLILNSADPEAEVANLEARVQAGDLSDVAKNVPGMDPTRDTSLLVSLDATRAALEKADPTLLARLAMLGVYAPDTTFDLGAMQAVWGEVNKPLSQKEANDSAKKLIGYGLLAKTTEMQETGQAEKPKRRVTRYRQHIILRAYALGLLRQDGEKAGAAASRHAGHYLRIADSYTHQTWRAVAAEAANITQAAEQICDALGDNTIDLLGEPEPPEQRPPFDEEAARAALAMARATRHYVHSQRVHAGRRWLRAGLAAARLLPDEHQREGRFLNELGMWHDNRGQPVKALEYFEQALPIREEVGDRAGLAATLNNIGTVYQATGQPEKALGYYERDAAISEEIGDRAGLATTLTNIGTVYLHTGQPGKALETYERALPIFEEVGDRAGLATTLNNIGMVYDATGQPGKTLEHYKRALAIYREIGAVQYVAAQFANIALLLHEQPALGRQAEAIPMLEEAIRVMERSGLQYDGGGTSIEEYRHRLAQWREEGQGS